MDSRVGIYSLIGCRGMRNIHLCSEDEDDQIRQEIDIVVKVKVAEFGEHIGRHTC